MNGVKESLIKSQNTLSRHSGACQNLVKTKTYSALASCVALGLCSRLDSTDYFRVIVPPASMQSWMLVASDSMSSRDISSILQVVFTSMTECILDQRVIKFSASILLILSFALSSVSYAQAAADGFGRLFTTPEERRNLQVLRYSEPEIEEIIEIIVEIDEIPEIAEEKTEQRNIEGITLNGIVYRKGSKSTVWLNGSNSYEGSLASEYFRINEGDVNSEKVSVTVPEADLKFDLKVGQTYDPNEESLLDIVEEDGIVTSRE